MDGGGKKAVLSLQLPRDYPASEQCIATCTCGLLSRKSEAHLNVQLSAFLAELDVGEESVMEVATWTSEAAASAVEAQKADAAEAAEKAASAKAATASVDDSEWRRFFFWCDHLLEGG